MLTKTNVRSWSYSGKCVKIFLNFNSCEYILLKKFSVAIILSFNTYVWTWFGYEMGSESFFEESDGVFWHIKPSIVQFILDHPNTDYPNILIWNTNGWIFVNNSLLIWHERSLHLSYVSQEKLSIRNLHPLVLWIE